MSTTPKLNLPLIAEAQAQKHVTHNEALEHLDALVQATVLDHDLASPPASPNEGEAYIVAASATGDWSGQENSIAVYRNGGWVFHAPQEGWRVWVADESVLLVWDGAAWGLAVNAITSLNPADGGKVGINTTADATNRLAVKSDAVLFSHDDASGTGSGDVRFKVNKAAASNTASLLFQSNWSGRAEMGLTGDDDFRLKVGDDGNAWHEAMLVDGKNGSISFPNGFGVERHLPASVEITGGSDWWGPADHFTLGYTYGSGLSLVDSRMYFMPFFVPRQLLLLGCFVSLYTASTTAGALLRTGVYHLGTPAGNNWNIGSLVVDFGAADATTADNKIFDLATPLLVQPGWYVTAFGVSGAGAQAIYGRWLTPGTQRVFPYGNGSSARPRVAGHSLYLYEGSSGSEINNGLPTTWSRNPVSDATSTNAFVYQMVFPKWRLP